MPSWSILMVHIQAQKLYADMLKKEIVPQNYRFELSHFNSEGNDVTYTCKVFINNILRDTNTDGLDVRRGRQDHF